MRSPASVGTVFVLRSGYVYNGEAHPHIQSGSNVKFTNEKLEADFLP